MTVRGTDFCKGTRPERATGLGPALGQAMGLYPSLNTKLRGHKYGSNFFCDSPVEGGSAHRA